MAGSNGTVEVDLGAFRAGLGGPGLVGPATVPLSGPRASFLLGAEAHVVAQLGYGLDPRRVPVAALQLMSSNPAVYLAERIVTGVIRRPDLFSVRHDDPAMRAEVEAWLWPLLPRLASSAARAFAYGAAAVVLDWGRKVLMVPAPQPDEEDLAAGAVEPDPGTMVATPPRTVFVRVVEAHPDLTGVDLDALGEQIGVRVGGQAVGIDRAHVWSWDAEFGEIVGQGARRRAWRDYCEHLIVTLLRDKYLERSVDPVRKGRAPSGKETIDGVVWEIPSYVAYLLDQVRGSGQIVLPSVRDEHGEFKYDFELLEVSADRAKVFGDALNKTEANLLLSYLVAATFAGGDAEAGANQVLDGLLRDHVEAIATMVAQGLTRLVGIVHRVNFPATVAEPEIVATDVGKATARKIYLDVLRLVTQAAQGEVAVRTDVPKLLDKLGVDVREEDDAPESTDTVPTPGLVGRPVDPFGGRQGRRESAPPGSPGETSSGAPVADDGTEDTQGGGSAGGLSANLAAETEAALVALARLGAEDRARTEGQVARRLEAAAEEAAERMARATELLTAEKMADRLAEAEARGRAAGIEAGASRAALDALRAGRADVEAAEGRGLELGERLGEARGRALALAEASPAAPPTVVVNNTVPSAPPTPVVVHNQVNLPPPVGRTLKIKRDAEGKMTGGEIKDA